MHFSLNEVFCIFNFISHLFVHDLRRAFSLVSSNDRYKLSYDWLMRASSFVSVLIENYIFIYTLEKLDSFFLNIITLNITICWIEQLSY